MSKTKTPMTDLYRWQCALRFASNYSNVYHGYKFGSTGMLGANGARRLDSLCNRDFQTYPLRGDITATNEADISGVRRPCKRCLAALRKAKKEAEK